MQIERFAYPYGIFYDVNLPESMDSSDTVIIYTSFRGLMESRRTMSSLEGVFISREPVGIPSNALCKRNEMTDFAKKYAGDFHKFF